MTQRTRFVKLHAERHSGDHEPFGEVYYAVRSITHVWADQNGTFVETTEARHHVRESVDEVLAAIAGAEGEALSRTKARQWSMAAKEAARTAEVQGHKIDAIDLRDMTCWLERVAGAK